MKKSIFLLLISPLCLSALGGKPEVIKGVADYEVTGSTEVVRVSDKAILEYQKFNLEKQEMTRYEQPTPKSTLLCRIRGKDPSMIRGKLEANGKLLFINPNGIIFSETAHVHVGTLIASTLDIQNDDFLKGRYKFTLTPEALETSIVNKGCIEADHNVIFMAAHLVNHGVISAKAGKIALMGGEVMTLDFDGDEMIQFAVEAPVKNGYIEQGGKLAASQVYMKLPMAQKIIRTTLNDTGVVEASYIEVAEGVIRLKAGSYIHAKALHISGDTIQIAGELKIAGLCELFADQEIQWIQGNSVGHLNTQTNRLLIAGPITADKWTSHVSGKYVLENSITINNNSII
ncbi:MAG: filamentous hemagglutinin N-terminal domain-containing protein, partial [Rhabdochlamydiaceae bacterium]